MVSTVAECPVAPEHTVCSEQEARSLLVAASDSLTDPDWAARGSNLLPWPLSAVKRLVEPDTHTHTRIQTHTQASMPTYTNPQMSLNGGAPLITTASAIRDTGPPRTHPDTCITPTPLPALQFTFPLPYW